MAGKTMGFVGFGNIAQMTANMAKVVMVAACVLGLRVMTNLLLTFFISRQTAFGMKILALRRNTSKGDNYGGNLADKTYSLEEKAELFANSDFVVCSLPGTDATLDFCSTAEFAAMKKTGVFISIGRSVIL
jgi:phosphoglycerate dehydrogenase-like enzyme